MAEMNPLRRRMIEDMQVRNLSPVTQRCYVHAVAKFARHFNRSPDRLGLEEIRAYQIHLTTTGISWAGFNVAVCALRFLYGVTLGRTAMVERIPYARKQQQLPVILSADEIVVVAVVGAVAGKGRHYPIDPVEQGPDLGAVVGILVGQHQGDDPAGVGVRRKME